MSIYISGSSGCVGELRGIFSGSLPVHPTASYYNNDGGTTVCTGSLIVSNYVSGSTTTQRVHAYLGDGSGGATWTQLGGQPGAYGERSVGSNPVTEIISTAVYRPGATIFADLAVGTGGLVNKYTLLAASEYPFGTTYTIVADSDIKSTSRLGITASSGELNYLIQCKHDQAIGKNKTFFSSEPGKLKAGTRLVLTANSASWWVSGITHCSASDISDG